jgi:CheY-like chemotaxis protein
MPSVRVLLVDEDDAVLDVTRSFLEREADDLDITTVTTIEDALDRVEAEAFDVVVSDYKMPHMNGVEFSRAVHDRKPDVPFFLFTARDSADVERELAEAPVTGYVRKQTGTDQYRELVEKIHTAVGD